MGRYLSQCILLAALSLTSLASAAPPTSQPTDAKKKIILIAGKKSHGPGGNGQHDYNWSVRLLKVMLHHSNVKDKVAVSFFTDGWPADQSSLETADTIMIISDGRDGDAYSETLYLANDDRIAFMEKQMKRGCGLVTFHFSTFVTEKYRDYALRWNGGYFQWETDGKKNWYSAIKTLQAKVEPATPTHPILKGIEPFTMNQEEFYYNLRFNPEDKRTVPILTVPALNGRAPDGNTVAWARDREDTGRAFGTSTGHFYENWKNDQYRKVILNAIAWTAKVEIPDTGVTSEFFDHEAITKALTP